MVYLTALLLSLLACAQLCAYEITRANITKVKYGQVPNSSVALFPMFPTIQLLAVGVAWLTEVFAPETALWVLLGGFAILSLVWSISFAKLQLEFARVRQSFAKRSEND